MMRIKSSQLILILEESVFSVIPWKQVVEAASGSTYSALTSIKFPSATSASFNIDEVVTQTVTEASGKVVSWDSGTKILKVYQSWL